MVLLEGGQLLPILAPAAAGGGDPHGQEARRGPRAPARARTPQ